LLHGLFFPISKLAWLALAPSHILVWMLIGTLVTVMAQGHQRGARWMAATTAALFILLGVAPLGQWLARPLENTYPPPTNPPAHVDGIVTLGGGLQTGLTLSRGGLPAAQGSMSRLVTTMAIARRYPEARVIFSGGAGPLADTIAAKLAFDQMGLDPARLTLEAASRNTFENLDNTRRIVQPKPGETWVLATSALQMPRAMAVARSLGWTMTPWPTDYLTTPHQVVTDYLPQFNVASHLALVDQATHEWVGLLAYQLGGLGRSAS
jgi:uncharacterized SAM-binding protein YcdF (DUF218 family)